MTDVTAPLASPSAAEIGAAARARVRARYRAEARFRLYGALAIGLTALFLLVLIVDILAKGLPAFWHHSSCSRCPSMPRRSDRGGGATRRCARPTTSGWRGRRSTPPCLIESRQARRELADILSTGAADDLQQRVLADPALVGQTVTTRLLLSDDADLYLKGWGTDIVRRQETRGTATPSGTTGEITVASTADDFAPTCSPASRSWGRSFLQAD